jgi:hypothetical protein
MQPTKHARPTWVWATSFLSHTFDKSNMRAPTFAPWLLLLLTYDSPKRSSTVNAFVVHQVPLTHPVTRTLRHAVCRTSVIMTLWATHPLILRYMTSQQNIQSPPILKDFRFATFFHETHLIHMTTSEESLRVLFFTRSLAVDLVH